MCMLMEQVHVNYRSGEKYSNKLFNKKKTTKFKE